METVNKDTLSKYMSIQHMETAITPSSQTPCDLVVKHCMLGNNIWQQTVLVSFEVERRHSSKVKEIIKGSHTYHREKQLEQLNKA